MRLYFATFFEQDFIKFFFHIHTPPGGSYNPIWEKRSNVLNGFLFLPMGEVYS